MNKDYLLFEEVIKYTFRDKDLLRQALTHSSYGRSMKDYSLGNNERLEFLGDAFFDAIISEYTFVKYPDIEEGRLTKLRAKVVCEKSLADVGRKLGIGEFLFLGRGEEKSGGRTRNSIIADAVEAVIGALVLDGGYEAAKEFVLREFVAIVEIALSSNLNEDYKSELQEKIQVFTQEKPRYVTVREEGPDHDKTFFVDLYLEDKLIGQGSGRTKKEAERNAAKQALERGEPFVL